jgi:hypothetical protein
LGFVGNYAPRGLSPQIDGMPVILERTRVFIPGFFFYENKKYLKDYKSNQEDVVYIKISIVSFIVIREGD